MCLSKKAFCRFNAGGARVNFVRALGGELHELGEASWKFIVALRLAVAVFEPVMIDASCATVAHVVLDTACATPMQHLDIFRLRYSAMPGVAIGSLLKIYCET